MNVRRFQELPIMGILRGIDETMVDPLVEAVCAAGLKTIEVTMNTPGAPALIRRMVRSAAGRLTVGAGTVLTLEDLHAALDAGARFSVLPALIPDVVAESVRLGVPVFPGALTPTEIFNAWRAGATMVKVFPAKFFGAGYFKEVRGPFQDVPLLACGGVNANNVHEFFSNGAAAVSFGASIFRKEWLQGDGYDRIREGVHDLIQGYVTWKAGTKGRG